MTLSAILVALLCLAILIGWHELGHFVAARVCGVHVIRFSIGFGKSLLSWRDSKGTVYSLAVIPFGGYVRMLGEDGLSEDDGYKAEHAFSAKPVWQRLIIVLAGPAANIVLAIVLLFFVSLSGTTVQKPVLGEIIPDTPAFAAGMRAGETITSVDNTTVTDWRDIALQLVERIGETGTIGLVTVDSHFRERSYSLVIHDWLDDVIEPDPLVALGLQPFRPNIPAVIHEVMADSAAQRAGMHANDRIVSIAGVPMNDWYDVVAIIRASANHMLPLVVERNDAVMQLQLVPDSRQQAGNTTGFAGITPQPVDFPQEMLVQLQPGLFDAIAVGFNETWRLARLVVISLYKLITGEIALGNISGPVGIIKVAGETAGVGFLAFLSFTAYLSVSLGILNLLPVPVLDGGQAVMLCVEAVTRKQVPLAFQVLAMRIGMFVLIGIMLLATIHDIYRL